MRTRGGVYKSGLLWTGLLLAGLAVVVLAASGLETSWAAPPAARAGERHTPLNGVPDGQAVGYTNVITHYTYLPAVFRDFAYAQLSITKSALPWTFMAAPDRVVTYTLTIKNEGDTTGSLLTVYDALPAGFTFQSMASGSDVSTLPAGTTGTITWSGPWTMTPGSQLRFIYRVTPSQTPGQYTNTANVTAQDAYLPPQPASATVTVEPALLMQDNLNDGISRWTPFLNYPPRLEEGQWYWGTADGIGGSGALTHDCCAGPKGKVASDALMMYLQPGAEDWTNYRVEAKMLLRGGVDNQGNPEPTSGDPIGLWVRGHYKPSDINAQWVDGYYVVIVGKTDEPIHWVRLAQMQIPGDCTTACKRPQNQYAFNNPFLLTRSADLAGPFEHNRWYTLAVEVRDNNIKVWLDGQLVIDYTDTNQPFLAGTVGFKAHETKTASFDDIIVTPLP